MLVYELFLSGMDFDDLGIREDLSAFGPYEPSERFGQPARAPEGILIVLEVLEIPEREARGSPLEEMLGNHVIQGAVGGY